MAFTCSTSFSPFLTFSHILLPFLFPFSSCLYRSETSLPAETAGFRWYSRYEAGTAGIFFGTKQRVYLYRCIDRYNIYRSYRPVLYGINFLTKPYATHVKYILLNFGYKTHTHLSILLWILLVIINNSLIHLIAVTALSKIFQYWSIVPRLSSTEPCKENAYDSYITCDCSYNSYSSCHITSLYVPLFYTPML